MTDKEEKEEKKDLKELLRQSEYYLRRRQDAIEGNNVEEFVKELETFAAGLWKSLYEANEELVRLRESLGNTEEKTNQLEEILLAQLFESVTDGVTN